MSSNYNISTNRKIECDTVVIGGGVAGCAAAISSARGGAKTILVEAGGTLGGQAGIGLVTPLSSTSSKSGERFGGLTDEIIKEVIALTKKYVFSNEEGNRGYPVSPHILKYVFLKKCMEYGVDVHFHSMLCDAETRNGKVDSVIIKDKSGFLQISAKSFIDASGDADLILLSGDDNTLGSEKDVFEQLVENQLDINHSNNAKDDKYEDEHLMQPVSLFFVMRGVDVKKASELNNKKLVFGDLGITKERFNSWEFAGTTGFQIVSENIPTPQNRVLVTLGRHQDEAVVNMSRILNINGGNAEELSRGEAQAQLQLIAIVDFLKTFIPGFENAYLVETSSRLGIRESYRLRGRYVLSGSELINGASFEDTVCRGYYIVDIHDPRGRHGAIGGHLKKDYFEVPYRSLCSNKFTNLLACGRCISVDHVAHSATRIQGTCILTGQAAGCAAALAVKTNTDVCDVDTNLLTQQLKKDGMII
ncbi:MAG: FAD-dependent oxidoreductase [Clostridia bacterium]|nr:FAD-dependent oxidoreductase [Clostridia bacterium]